MPVFFENRLEDTLSQTLRGYKFTPADGVAGGTLTYQSKREYSRYWMERIPADLAGHAFVFRKVVRPGEEQSVSETLLADRAENDLCDCRGFASTGHCKHLDVLRDLAAHGQLPAPLAETDAELCDPEADFASTELDAGMDAWCDRMEAESRPFPVEATTASPGSDLRREIEAERVAAGCRADHPDDMPF